MSNVNVGRRGFIQGLEAAKFALLGAEGDIDFLKFKLDRLIKENREVLAKEEAEGCDYPNCTKPWDYKIQGMNLCPEHYDEYVSECGKDEN